MIYISAFSLRYSLQNLFFFHKRQSIHTFRVVNIGTEVGHFKRFHFCQNLVLDFLRYSFQLWMYYIYYLYYLQKFFIRVKTEKFRTYEANSIRIVGCYTFRFNDLFSFKIYICTRICSLFWKRRSNK
jgi:hypothetical protein